MEYSERMEIRKAYDKYLPRIMAHEGYYYPYFYDWTNGMTHIEYNVWQDIRFLGLPFYPQFPVKQYFIDFADPKRKIAIEVDGAMWHKDKEKDKKRQQELEKLGWRFLRISGRTSFRKNLDTKLRDMIRRVDAGAMVFPEHYFDDDYPEEDIEFLD